QGFLVALTGNEREGDRRKHCSRSCPHHCLCYEHAELVDCRDRGFVRVPRGLPHGTWLLELGGNNLSVIGTRAFIGLWSLRVLVLTNNQIEDIEPQGSMDMLPGLEVHKLRL
uniref:LRRNT domain-containing protein n=1 Tax=Stegastes partitus TaxID=144197 RepID=A0A3B5A3U2_9TELE